MSKPKPIKAISMSKTPLGWVVQVLTIREGRVTQVEKSEPDLRAIALETLQREMYQHFWKE